jgi:hypothetical protein
MTHLDKAAPACPRATVLAMAAGHGCDAMAIDLSHDLFWATLAAHLQKTYDAKIRRSTEWETHNAR